MATMRLSVLIFLFSASSAFAQFTARTGPPASGFMIPPAFTGGDSLLSMRLPLYEKKKPFLAAVYSLLLPGMGELYAGDYGSGKFFTGAEAGLWLTFTTFELYGNALRTDARTYSAVNAGVSVAGKDDQFFVDVGNFMSVSDYNDKKMRDRDLSKVYDPAAGFSWSWTSDGARSEFRAQRVRSETMYNNKKFVVAAIIINHVASAINAVRTVIARNKEMSALPPDLRFSARVIGEWAQPQGVMLTMSKEF